MSLPVQKPEATDELVSQFELVGRPQLRLDEVIVPVHVLHDHLWAPAAGFANIAAGGVGFRSILVLSNTQGIDRPVQVYRLLLSTAAGTAIVLARPTATIAGLTTVTTATMQDFRRGVPTASLGSRNNAAAPAGTSFVRVPVASSGQATFDLNVDITLGGGPPGFGADTRSLIIMPSADNVDLSATVFWRESTRREPNE